MRRVLVADDETHIRDLAELVLRNSGLEVDCARDGEAAWERLSSNRYDLVITDHDMPLLKGLDLIARIKKESIAVPVILMSGTIGSSSQELAGRARPDGFLPKPFSVAMLLALASDYLEMR